MIRISRIGSLATLLIASFVTVAEEPLVLVQTIALKGVDGKLDHLAVDSKGQRLFVANKPNNTLDIVDLQSGMLVKQIADQGKISGVAYAADLDMIYVGNGSGVCNGFSGTDFKLVFSTKAPGADNVHYHSGNKMVYVAHDETLTILDAKSGEEKAAIKLPGSIHGFKLDQKAGKAFAVLTKPSVIAVIDLEKNEVVSKFPMTLSDAGSPIAYDAKNALVFVGSPKKPMIIVFDTKTGKEIASVVIPAGIDDLHFDSKRNRLYASCGESALVVIERKSDKYEVLATLKTPHFSRTCAWGAGKLYLGVPMQKDSDGPSVQVFEAKPSVDDTAKPE